MRHNLITTTFIIPIVILIAGCGEDRETLLVKAEQALQANDTDTSEQAYRIILARQPIDAEAIQGMVSVTLLRGATEEHLHWCRQLLRLRPWDRHANIVVGKELAKEGNFKDAVVRLNLAYQESQFKQEKTEALFLLQQLKKMEQAARSRDEGKERE